MQVLAYANVDISNAQTYDIYAGLPPVIIS